MSPHNGKPIKDSRPRSVQVSIWYNEMQQDGESRIRHFIRVRKRHRRGHGSRKGTGYDRPEELRQLATAVQEAFESMVLTQNKDVEEMAT